MKAKIIEVKLKQKEMRERTIRSVQNILSKSLELN